MTQPALPSPKAESAAWTRLRRSMASPIAVLRWQSRRTSHDFSRTRRRRGRSTLGAPAPDSPTVRGVASTPPNPPDFVRRQSEDVLFRNPGLSARFDPLPFAGSRRDNLDRHAADAVANGQPCPEAGIGLLPIAHFGRLLVRDDVDPLDREPVFRRESDARGGCGTASPILSWSQAPSSTTLLSHHRDWRRPGNPSGQAGRGCV